MRNIGDVFKMKIIFLDIDGVLNSVKSMKDLYNDQGIRGFNDVPAPKHVKNLNRITEETGAKIVVSSTWRKLHSIISLMYIFHLCGIKGEIIGCTPVLHKERGHEIQAWLDETEYKDIEKFIIIDDDSDMEHLMDYLVKIDNRYGLTEKDVHKSIEILNG